MNLYNKKLELIEMLEDAITRGGDSVFEYFRHANGDLEKVTYNQIKNQADILIKRLSDIGLKKGERVAVITTMRPYWYSLLYALLKSGYIMVCIDPGIPPLQIKRMMEETECKVVFTCLPNFTCDLPVYSMEEGFHQMNTIEKVDALKPSAELPKDTFFVLFSSGTTSENRKGVLLPASSVAKGIELGMYNKAYTPRKRDLMLFPPYHIAALVCTVFDIYNNTKMYFMEKLTPNSLSVALEEFKPDNICTVPSVLTPMMKKMKSNLSSFAKTVIKFCGFCRRCLGINLGKFLGLSKCLKGLMIGGSPCDEETMRFFLDIGVESSLAYGLTELGAPLAATGKGYYPIGTGVIMDKGHTLDIRVVNPDEEGRGEVEILSPLRMISYLDPKQNEGCFTEDGYYKTGDLGYFKGKNLVISGRKKEAIVLKNGEKLLPEEIEKQYQNIDHIDDLVAFKVKDVAGCDAFSLAVIKDKNGFPDEAIKLRVLDRVTNLESRFKPKDVYVLKSFPYSSSHKVQRFRLTEMAEKKLLCPETESMQIIIDEDEQVSKLRGILVTCAGEYWKTCELSAGTPLNLSSLELMELCVSIQDEFGIDFFALENMPETFGEMIEAINNFESQDKTKKQKIDFSQYPKKVNVFGRGLSNVTGYFGKNMLYKVKTTGKENIPTDKNFIICSNHVTNVDPLWIITSLDKENRKKTAVVGKMEILQNKFLSTLVATQNYIPVDRNGNIGQTLERCKELLLQGWNILIFPEGTAFENAKEMLPFKQGAARLSLSTNTPILATHIKGVIPVNCDEAKFLPPKSDNLEVVFGELVYPNNETPEQINARLRAAIEKL